MGELQGGFGYATVHLSLYCLPPGPVVAVALLDDEPHGPAVEARRIDLEAREVAVREPIAGPPGVGEHRRMLFFPRERRDLVSPSHTGAHPPGRGAPPADRPPARR